jgi:two-component system LytT family response regulator
MIRTIIIDDEENIRSLLRELLRIYCPDVEIVAETGNIENSIEAILRLKPQLLLLDIKLEDGSGFELLEKLGSHDFSIIFITAYEEFALKAFRQSAVDYILKPVVPEELMAAIKKVRNTLKHENDDRIRVSANNTNSNHDQEKKIVLRTADKFHFVTMNEIIRCESDSSYTTFFFLNGKSLIISRTMKEFEEILCEFSFYRPHKSYLINIKHIKAFEKSDGGFIIMSDDSKVPLSDKKRDEFFRLMETL